MCSCVFRLPWEEGKAGSLLCPYFGDVLLTTFFLMSISTGTSFWFFKLGMSQTEITVCFQNCPLTGVEGTVCPPSHCAQTLRIFLGSSLSSFLTYQPGVTSCIYWAPDLMSPEFSIRSVSFLQLPMAVHFSIPREVNKLTQSINGAIGVSKTHLRE